MRTKTALMKFIDSRPFFRDYNVKTKILVKIKKNSKCQTVSVNLSASSHRNSTRLD